MYFKEKEDTNIDNDFKKNLSIKDLFNKFKLPIIIIITIIIISIIVLIIFNKKTPTPINNITYFLDLKGDTNITLYKGSEYIEAGYTAYDSKGNNLDNEVIVTNNLDTSNIGTYVITYLLHDISKERNINVIEKPIGATYIHLLGNSIIYLKLNEKYKEPGYLVTDTVDSNLKDKVKITSNINSKEPGIYKVTYTVTNSSGVTTSASRKVIVMSSDTSLSLDNSEPTNKEVGINIHVVDNYFDYLILPNKEKITSKDYTYKVSENGTYKFTIYNKKGSHSEETIKITNIDKIKPSGSCTGYMENGKSYITVTATDDMGISKYLVDNVTSTTNTITINKELPKASVTIYDKAGNNTEISCNLEEKSIKYNAETTLKKCASSGCKHQYWLNVPENAKSNMPLVIFIHGSDESNKPNEVKSLPITKYVLNEYRGEPFIYIAPVAGSGSWWSDSLSQQLKALIDEVVANYKIDQNRIYLTGFSIGARASWNLVNSYPNLFAAAVPVSFCPDDSNQVSNFKTTKIRAFYGSEETRYINCINNFVNEINSNGGTATKESIQGKNHSGMQKALNYNDIFTWMLNQKK